MLAKYGLTLNLVDEFDYINEDGSSSDGKIKTLVNGDESYIYDTPEELFKYSEVSSYMKYDSADGPFINKEPRFHAWVIYPDCVFRGVTVKMQAGMITPDKQVRIYPIDNDGVEFNGTYYYPYGGAEENNSAFYHLPYATGATVKNCSYAFLVKKHLEPASATNYPQTPWYDMRYAEVLLNYAEAVVENGSGYGDKALAKRCLNEVRHRAGFKDDIELSIENVLHEEKVEFAFENVWPCILYRRRAFNNPDKGICIEGAEKKLTLLPIVDLSGDEAKYIFIRATSYFGDVKRFSGVFRVRPDDYYLSIPNYINNKIEDNNK